MSGKGALEREVKRWGGETITKVRTSRNELQCNLSINVNKSSNIEQIFHKLSIMVSKGRG